MPDPEIPRAPVEVLPDGFLAYDTQPWEYAPLPPETFLRGLQRADLESPEGVVAFIGANGILSKPYNDRAILPPQVQQELESTTTEYSFAEAHWLDAAWYLHTARALVGTWLARQEGTSLTEPWRAEGFYMPDEGVPLDDDRALDQFVVSMNEGLAQFRFHVERSHALGDGTAVEIGAPQIGLWSALCFQLANAMAKGDVTRRCGNESCGLPFVHQLGGALHGQNRSRGVLRFCSPGCAQQQYQREYRRRKAAQS